MDTKKPSGKVRELRDAANNVWIGPAEEPGSLRLIGAIETVCYLADRQIMESGFAGSIMAGAVREAFGIEKEDDG